MRQFTANPARVNESERRARGAYYTPPHVADWIVANVDAHGTTWDPAVGDGVFLMAVVRATPPERRRFVVTNLLFGYDTDEAAVRQTRANLTEAASLNLVERAKLAEHVIVRDTLAHPPTARFDVAIGNPPFLSRLRDRTAMKPELSLAMKARYGAAIGPYTDAAALFWMEMLRAASRVGIVLPASTFAARDAHGARQMAFETQGGATHAWMLPSFPGVGVAIVAAVMGPGPTTRWCGKPPSAIDAVQIFPDEPTWSPLLHHSAEPPPTRLVSSGTLADIADATADFRDEYYAIKGHVAEETAEMRVVTTGLIDVAGHAWSRRDAAIHGARFRSPTVPVSALHPRQHAQRRPKILVATQTPVIEAVADPDGVLLGTTPVVAVYPKRWTLWRTAAVMLSPVVSAWAMRTYRGSGQSLDAIKLSARQLLTMPLPASTGETEPFLREAEQACMLAHTTSGATRQAALLAMADATTRAYQASNEVTEWWKSRVRELNEG